MQGRLGNSHQIGRDSARNRKNQRHTRLFLAISKLLYATDVGQIFGPA